MSAADPIAGLLSALDRPEPPRREFRAELRGRLLADLAGPPVGRAVLPRRRALLLALAVALLVTAVASATYLLTRGGSSSKGGRVSAPLVLSAETPRLPAQLSFEGDGRVYLMGRNGATRRIGASNGSLSTLAWSPDGSRLLVIRNGSPYAMRPDGRLGRPLTARAWSGWGAWSPDGRRVAFVTGAFSQGARIVTTAADGSGERVVAAVRPYSGTGGLAWSPDGTRLAFSARIGEHAGLFVVPADGSAPPRLVVPNPPRIQSIAYWSPSWAPARRIAFTDWRGTLVVGGEGGRPRRIDSGRDIVAAWSPDGARLAVARQHEIVVVDPTGKQLRRLPGCACVRVAPGFLPRLSWSPDGTLLAYSGGHGIDLVPSRGIYVVRVADGRVIRVAASMTMQFDRPLWRPTP